MTEEELQAQAYIIASSNSLTEALSYNQLQEISDENLVALAWEPFERWTSDELYTHIEQIATDIINAFSGKVKDE